MAPTSEDPKLTFMARFQEPYELDWTISNLCKLFNLEVSNLERILQMTQ